ncbi:MFS transporter [Planobispora siamensis]
MILLLAVTCGVAVGNVYFPQAVNPSVASGLSVTPDAAALVVTAAQFGYAAGIFLLVPLGDRLPHRRLIVTLLALTGLGLLAAGAVPALAPLIGVSALVGVTTVVAQIIGPMAMGLVADDRRGEVSGILLSGSIGGMLLSRTVGGAAGQWLGWRAPYLLAAALTLLAAALLARALPATTRPVRQRPPSAAVRRRHPAPPQTAPARERHAAPPQTAPPSRERHPAPPVRERYPALLAGALRLLRAEPDLRRSCFYQAMLFAGFSALWTSVALLLTGPAYGLGTSAVGALALVNAATMLCTPLAGRQVDRRGPDAVNLVCMLGAVAAALVLLPGGLGGAAGLTALVLGSLLLDVAMQSGMVANQVRIYALRPEIRSRLNTAYMTCAYVGGAMGSWLGARAYAHAGWRSVCALVAALAALALVRHLKFMYGRRG